MLNDNLPSIYDISCIIWNGFRQTSQTLNKKFFRHRRDIFLFSCVLLFNLSSYVHSKRNKPDATQNNPTAPARPADAGRSAMPGYASQMQAMQQMHDKMLAAKTPEERNALMAEHMKLMRSGMAMMGEMGPGMMQGPSGHMAGRNGTLEQRMDMMQAMMQMMMDRMAAMPPAK